MEEGVVILGVTGAVVGGLYAVTTPFLLPAFRRVCLPYVPATTAQVDNVFSVLKRAAGAANTSTTKSIRGTVDKSVLVDLGSGDGRIVSVVINLIIRFFVSSSSSFFSWYSSPLFCFMLQFNRCSTMSIRVWHWQFTVHVDWFLFICV